MGNMLWNGSSGSDESGNAINLPKELRPKNNTAPLLNYQGFTSF